MYLVSRAPQSDWRHIFADVGACPPAAVAWLGELIMIPIHANEFWRRVREWVARKQTENFFFTFEEFLHKREDPGVKRGWRHRRKPHLPVESPMIRRHDARPSIHVTWFPFELVLAPFSIDIGNLCV